MYLHCPLVPLAPGADEVDGPQHEDGGHEERPAHRGPHQRHHHLLHLRTPGRGGSVWSWDTVNFYTRYARYSYESFDSFDIG